MNFAESGSDPVILGVMVFVFFMVIFVLTRIVHNHREKKKAR